MELKHRMSSVDMVRGIAVILMIFTHLWITFFIWINHPIGNALSDLGGYLCFTLFLFVSGYVYGLAFKSHTFVKIIKRSGILLVTYVLLGALSLMMTKKPLATLWQEPIFLEEYLLAFALLPVVTYIATTIVTKFSRLKRFIQRPKVRITLLLLGFACVVIGRYVAKYHDNFALSLFIGSFAYNTFPLLSYLVVFALGGWLGWYFTRATHENYKKGFLAAMGITFLVMLVAIPIDQVYSQANLNAFRWPPALIFISSSMLISLLLIYVATAIIGTRPLGIPGRILAWFGNHALDLLILHLILIYTLSNLHLYNLQPLSFFERDTYFLFIFWAIPIFLTLLYVTRTVISYVTSRVSKHAFIRRPFIFPKKTRIVYGILLLLMTVTYVGYYFYTRPYVQGMNPDMDQMYSSDTIPAVVTFDKPIDPNQIKVGTAPTEIGVNVSYIEAFAGIMSLLQQMTGGAIPFHLYTGIRMTPQHSLPYNTGFMYYIVGITSPTGIGGVHEHGYVMKTPNFPKIVDTSIDDQQTDVSITEPLRITTDEIITTSYQIVATFTPAVTYTVKQESPTSLAFHFDEPLKQGKDYKVLLQHGEQRVDLNTKEATLLDDLEDAQTIHFKTVIPPDIKDMTPDGVGVSPKTDITVTFAEPMDENSIIEGITIDPAIEVTRQWSTDMKKLTLHPVQPLEKATKYTVTLTDRIRTAKGGSLPKQFSQSFETVGHVRVISNSPKNGSGGQSVSGSISITFDQAVDKNSAQQHVSISPNIGVKYSWKGNTLMLSPKSSLAYQTRYTVTIKPGIKGIEGMDGQDTQAFSFTTRQSKVTIHVPLIKQPNGSFYCNVVATQMALSAKGVGSSISSIVGSIGSGTPYNSGNQTGGSPNADWINNYGVHWGPLASYINSRGRTAVIKTGWTLSGIASEIANGNPVIIFWYNGVSSTTMNSWYSSHGARPGLHSVVVYGFRGPESNPDTLYVKDPWPTFNQEAYSASAFRSKWAYFGNRAIVVK